ncbi:MAG: tetratricopeptide repeat protein [Gammaproteobacteria bacterium]|nr:tetratricopeptide repeat protein [Gammaproteobacteria bacterium]
MGDRLPRKLAAILYADVAGYSRLTGDDEDATHRTLSEYLDITSSAIESHGGQVMHYAGDAVLAKFGAVVDAMSAAVAIQGDLARRNESFSDERKVEFRIGVNLGDVIEDRGDIYGDGVNVAARLESLAEPGGICISDAVRSAVGKKLDLDYEDMGEQEVKNIAEPVRAYKVVMAAQEEPKAGEAVEPELELPDKPSIAVLPFTNMSGDPEQEYFSDGLTEDIITELSHFRDLSVTARHSSFAFRGQSVDIVEVGQKLNVHYVLEGSIRKAGNRIRVTAQLIDTSTGTHVWAERYDRNLEDIFAVQDEVVRIISVTLIGRVQHAGHELAKRKPPSSLKAYDCVALGLNHFYKWTREDNRRARELFEQAVEIDPEYAPAYAWLAEAHFREGLNAWSVSYKDSFSLFYDYAVKAVALDDNDSRTHTALGVAYLFRGEHDLAHSHLERALALNPSDTRTLVHLARCEALAGDPAKGVDRLAEALRFNPLANYHWYAGQIDYIARRYEEAVQVLSSLSSPNALVHAFLAASHGQLGNTAEAHQAASLFVSAAKALVKASGAPSPKSWVQFATARYPFKRREDAEHLVAGLEKAGLS